MGGGGGKEENRENPPLNKTEAQLCQKEYKQHMRETNAFMEMVLVVFL